MRRNIVPRLNGFLAFTPLGKHNVRQMTIAAKTKLGAIINLLDEYDREYLILEKLQVIEFGKDTIMRVVGLKRNTKQTIYMVRWWIITDDPIYKDELVLLLHQAQYEEYSISKSPFDIWNWTKFYWGYRDLGLLGTTNKYLIPFKMIQKIWQLLTIKTWNYSYLNGARY